GWVGRCRRCRSSALCGISRFARRHCGLYWRCSCGSRREECVDNAFLRLFRQCFPNCCDCKCEHHNNRRCPFDPWFLLGSPCPECLPSVLRKLSLAAWSYRLGALVTSGRAGHVCFSSEMRS